MPNGEPPRMLQFGQPGILENILGNVQSDVAHFRHDPVSYFLAYPEARLWHFDVGERIALWGPGPFLHSCGLDPFFLEARSSDKAPSSKARVDGVPVWRQ